MNEWLDITVGEPIPPAKIGKNLPILVIYMLCQVYNLDVTL